MRSVRRFLGAGGAGPGGKSPPPLPPQAAPTVEAVPRFPVGRRLVRSSLCQARSWSATYRAPINDMLLALNPRRRPQGTPSSAGHYGDFDGDITAAVLEEAGKLASDVLAPLNHQWQRRARHQTRRRQGDDRAGLAGRLSTLDRGRLERGVRTRRRLAGKACRSLSMPSGDRDAGAPRISRSASARCCRCRRSKRSTPMAATR